MLRLRGNEDATQSRGKCVWLDFRANESISFLRPEPPLAYAGDALRIALLYGFTRTECFYTILGHKAINWFTFRSGTQGTFQPCDANPTP